MNKKALIIVLIIGGWLFFGTVKETKAGTIVLRSVVFYDVQAGTVGGISGTYISYDLWSYYDPWVSGELFYYDPYQYLDSDQGSGVDSSYLGFPGITVDYTTNAYLPNKFLCAYSDHRLQLTYQQPPLYFDPYNIDSIEPQSYNGGYTLQISDNYLESNYSELPLYQVGWSWACVLTPTVQTVSFEIINSPVTNISADSSRIFPDRDTPSDQRDMKIVRVRAKLYQQLQGIKVYFNNYDVDDPNSDSIIDPNGNTGNDNNGERDAQGLWTPQSAGTLSGGSNSCPPSNGLLCRLTDANGEATIDFTVTRQPGDNFMVAASTDANYLNGVTVSGTGLQDSMGSQIQISSGQARRTNLLTVWRRLHIEVDSMRPAQQNFILGTIPNIVKIRAGYIATIPVTPSPFTLLEVNRFEGGRLVAGGASLPVTCDIANGVNCNTANTVRVQNTGSSSVNIPSNSQFQLYDDDDSNDNDGTNPDGDNGEDIPMPDICLIQGANMPAWSNCSTQGNGDDPATNVFAPAYVRPIYDIGDNNNMVPFVENAPFDLPTIYDFDQSDTATSPDFWTAYLLGAYQGVYLDDADPQDEDGDGIVPDASYGYTDLPAKLGSLIFMEVSRPKEYPLDYATRPVSRAYTAAHEIGHLFGGEHEDEGLMLDPFARTVGTFAPATLAKIRNAQYP